MNIYCCQFDIQWENKAANFAKVRDMLSAQGLEPESMVVLPEMFATGFSMNVPAIAEGVDSITEKFLSEIARQHRVYIIAGVAAQGKAGRGHNECAFFSPDGKLVTRYSKIHPFTLGGEADNYIAGGRIVLMAWQSFWVAPFICYDLRFPELFRAAMRRGAVLFTVIANWPVARIEHWVTLLRARAIENQAYVVGVNRCGSDPTLNYTGRSLIIDPAGQIIADAQDGEAIISADISPDIVTAYRTELPFLKDLRNDYEKLIV